MRTERAADAIASTMVRCRVSDVGVLLVGIAIAVGVVGVVVPVLPGALLVWAAIAVWAFAVGSATAWSVLAVVSAETGWRPGRQVARAWSAAPRRRAFRDARSWWVWCSPVSASSSSLRSGSSSVFRSASTSRNVGDSGRMPPHGSRLGRLFAQSVSRFSSSCQPPHSRPPCGWQPSWCRCSRAPLVVRCWRCLRLSGGELSVCIIIATITMAAYERRRVRALSERAPHPPAALRKP